MAKASDVRPISGGAEATMGFDFGTPSTEWVCNHNFGYKPVVDVLTDGGMVVEAEVLHVSVNQFRVYFAAPYTGSVRLT